MHVSDLKHDTTNLLCLFHSFSPGSVEVNESILVSIKYQ